MSRVIDIIVCDDIRHEDGGKVSLMGVYSGVMKVDQPQGLKPQIHVFTRVQAPVQERIKRAVVRLKFNDETIGEFDNDLTSINERIDAAINAPEQDSPRMFSMQMVNALIPVRFAESGILQAEVDVGDVVVQAPPIRVAVTPDQTD